MECIDMAVTKYSRQREAIKEYLAHTKEHPTADTVYMNIRSTQPNISLGTVYRNLNMLADQGEILKLNCQDGCDRFDGNPKPHYHFLCRGCGRVLDLEMEDIDHINEIAASNFGGTVEGHVTYFYGMCPNCVQKN
jgi:Fur family peroxide stress response transcriptional regulator